MNRKKLWSIESLWGSIREYTDHPNSIDSSLFKFTDYFSFEQSKEAVFSDSDGEYSGLLNDQVIVHRGRVIYLCDNHNKILVPLLETYERKNRELLVTHIDAHRDDALFLGEKPKVFNRDSLSYLRSHTRISDFFDALSETGSIGSIQRYTDSSSFLNQKVQECDVLSLDIDLFGEEGAFIDLEYKVKVIKEVWEKAPVICIAMSPGFIDQDYAREIIKIMLN